MAKQKFEIKWDDREKVSKWANEHRVNIRRGSRFMTLNLAETVELRDAIEQFLKDRGVTS